MNQSVSQVTCARAFRTDSLERYAMNDAAINDLKLKIGYQGLLA